MNFILTANTAALAVASLLPQAGTASAQNAVGAGATFPAALYQRWASEYLVASGERINYEAVGSSAGIRQVDARTVDFGASEMPISIQALARKEQVQFPTVIGGVVPVFNLKGIAPGAIRITGHALGDIYLGKITRWNDPVLRRLNPAVNLPDEPIAVVRRADGSGSTFLFTNYLSKVNAEWKARTGEGMSVSWPVGAGGKGNDGVAAFVSRLPYSIGYVEYSYVKQNNMSYMRMINAAGADVSPRESAFKAAAVNVDWTRSLHEVLTDQPHKDAWPMTGASFVIMNKVQDKPVQAAAALRFFHWAYKNGDRAAEDLSYVPMPAAVKLAAEKAWGEIQDTRGNPIVFR